MTDLTYNAIAFVRRLAMVLDLFWRPLPYDSGRYGVKLAWALSVIAHPFVSEESEDLARIREGLELLKKLSDTLKQD